MSKHSAIQFDPLNMRDAPRKHVLMQATLISAEGPQRVFVKDLTPSGAKLQCQYPLEEDCDVIFKRGGEFRAARVAWTNGDEGGLQFYKSA